MRGLKLRQIFFGMLLALLTAGLLSALVWKQNYYIKLSKNNQQLVKLIKKYSDTTAIINAQIRLLKRADRLEQVGKDVYGLDYSTPPVLVSVEKELAGVESQVAALPVKRNLSSSGFFDAARETGKWLTKGF